MWSAAQPVRSCGVARARHAHQDVARAHVSQHVCGAEMPMRVCAMAEHMVLWRTHSCGVWGGWPDACGAVVWLGISEASH